MSLADSSHEARRSCRHLFGLLTSLFCILVGFMVTTPSVAGQAKLLIISPHRKSMQQEFIPPFREFYFKKHKRPIQVEWIDQGGASDDYRYIMQRFEKNPKSSGIDIFFGGGEQPHYDLDSRNLLEAIELSPDLMADIPPTIGTTPLYPANKTWHAAAMTSFGILANNRVIKLLKLPEPKSWADLASPAYKDNISWADPRRSSSSVTIIMIILQKFGWEAGFDIIARIAANTKAFTHSSSDPVKAVLSGDAAFGLIVDYYGREKAIEFGPKNLSLILPYGETMMNSDPISVLKGAENKKEAIEFIEFILSPAMQKKLILPQGEKDGPLYSTIGRVAVNQKAYADGAQSPFSDQNVFFKFNMLEASQIHPVISDLFGTLFVDHFRDLKKLWNFLVERGTASDVFFGPPLSQEELHKLAKSWTNKDLRTRAIQSWHELGTKRYDLKQYLPSTSQK